MSNRQCPKCGEEYSDTYRTCPFCEEEAAIQKGKPLRRRSGKRVEKRQRDSSGGAGGVMLLLTGVIILGVVGYVFFGEQVADAMGIRSDPVQVDEDPAADPDPAGPTEDEPAQSAPDSTDQPPAPAEGDQTNPSGEDAPAQPDVPPEPAGPLTLSQSSFSIAAGETALLTTSGGTGEVDRKSVV